jgi:hypothetical protein
MTNPDAYVAIGDVFDCEGELRTVHRGFDCLLLPAVQLAPQQVRVLERHIAEYWNEVARYRLRTADRSGIDMAKAREWLWDLPAAVIGGDPDDPDALDRIDWHALGGWLGTHRNHGGYAELRKLHALLTGDETPAMEAPVPARCAFHGGEGDGGEFCGGCREDQDPSGASAFRGHGPGCGCPDCEGARRDAAPADGEGSGRD